MIWNKNNNISCKKSFSKNNFNAVSKTLNPKLLDKP